MRHQYDVSLLILQYCPHRTPGYVDSSTEPWKNAGAEAVCFVGKSAADACADQPLPSLGYLAPELQKRSEPVRALVKPCHSIESLWARRWIQLCYVCSSH